MALFLKKRECGASALTRNSEYLDKKVCIQRAYHQCNNLYCGITLRTLTEVDAIITESKPDFSIPIPAKTFPKNHYGDNQIELAL